MDRQRAQDLINKHATKIGKKLGRPAVMYRPVAASSPLASPNEIGQQFVRFDQKSDFSAERVALFGVDIWFAAFDRTDILSGDFITVPETNSTYYVLDVQDITFTPVVKCNRTVTIRRPSPVRDNGYNYGGNRDDGGELVMQGWPASILEGSKGERSVANLPGDTRVPWFEVHLSYFPGVHIRTHDRLTDDIDNEYIISSVELTDLGYRLTVGHAKA